MKTTAIQQVAHDLYDIEMPVEIHAKVMLLLKKHFETTEKQQIIDAYQTVEDHFGGDRADKYYNETYTTNKETLK